MSSLNDYAALNASGVHALDNGELQQALKIFSASISMQPSISINADAYLQRGYTLKDLGLFNDAASDFLRLIRAGVVPYNLHSLFQMGLLSLDSGQLEVAIDFYLKAGSLVKMLVSTQFKDEAAKLLPSILYNLSAAQSQHSDLDAALNSINGALLLRETDVDYFELKAEILTRSGKYTEAMEILEHCLTFKEHTHVTKYLLYIVGMNLKQYDLALKWGEYFIRDARSPKTLQTQVTSVLEDLRVLVLQSQHENFRKLPTHAKSLNKVKVVRELIDEKQYDIARLLLSTMSDDLGAEFLAKLPKLQHQQAIANRTASGLEVWMSQQDKIIALSSSVHVDYTKFLRISDDEELNQKVIDELSPEDSGLNGSAFDRVNLANVGFDYMEVMNVSFSMTNLCGASFVESSIFNCSFEYCDLSRSDFEDAQVEDTSFIRSNLTSANFRGANLRHAYFDGANIADAIFSTETILPDGSKWTPQTNVRKFSNAT